MKINESEIRSAEEIIPQAGGYTWWRFTTRSGGVFHLKFSGTPYGSSIHSERGILIKVLSEQETRQLVDCLRRVAGKDIEEHFRDSRNHLGMVLP